MFAALVALALLSLGTLISILLASVLAFGLDPPVSALVQRGWRRGVASLVIFAALFVAVFVLVLVSAGPVWDQIVEFVHAAAGLLGRADGQARASRRSPRRPTRTSTIKKLLGDLAQGLPDAATALLGVAGDVFGSVLSLVTLTFLALFLLMERPMITDWLFGFTPPDGRGALAAGARGLDLGGVVLADRQRRHLDHRRR